MQISALVDAIKNEPFKPLQIHTDGRIIAVDHPEQVLLTPDKATAVAIDPDGHIHILDVDRISSVTLKPRRGRKSEAK